MKNQIIDLIQEVITEEGGIYNTLFCCEETEEQSEIRINWVINKVDIKESINIILEHIISQILQTYTSNKYEPRKQIIDGNYREILFDDTAVINRFLPINYELMNNEIKFANLENYLGDIEVTDNGQNIYFKWKFPIYVIDKKSLNTY